MGTFRYPVLAILLLFMVGCENEAPGPALDESTNLLARKWRYEAIKINGVQIWNNRVNNWLEVEFNPAIRREVKRRKIDYNPTGYYLLDWIRRGEYELGTYGTPNWQPSTGTYVIVNDRLIHNRGTDWETSYYIYKLTENSFIRLSKRYMVKEDPDYNNSGNKIWEAGEEVDFLEIFVPDY